MLLKYVSNLALHFFVDPDVAPHFLHARNATGGVLARCSFPLLRLRRKASATYRGSDVLWLGR